MTPNSSTCITCGLVFAENRELASMPDASKIAFDPAHRLIGSSARLADLLRVRRMEPGRNGRVGRCAAETRGSICRFRAEGSPRTSLRAGAEGALLFGEPDEVAEKILRDSEALGGISRVTFQMNASSLPHAKLMAAIEMLGAKVASLVRQ